MISTILGDSVYSCESPRKYVFTGNPRTGAIEDGTLKSIAYSVFVMWIIDFRVEIFAIKEI